MSTRRRPRKGRKRIDAAIDALGQLGFSQDVVCKTVDGLLKVYGGDNGWLFIEEASYKLVIETILEEQEKEREEEDEGEGMPEARALQVCEKVVEGGEASSCLEALDDTPYVGPPDWKDIPCTDQGSRTGLHGESQHAATPREGGEPCSVSSDIGRSHLRQPIAPSRPTGRPCYGWISEDEDEDGEEDPPRSDGLVSQEHKVGALLA